MCGRVGEKGCWRTSGNYKNEMQKSRSLPIATRASRYQKEAVATPEECYRLYKFASIKNTLRAGAEIAGAGTGAGA